MDKLSRLSAEDRAELVAYLDGELDEEATHRVETVLASNSVARTDVEALARTYELLDNLPRAQASAEFTERTVASAKLQEVKPQLVPTQWVKEGRKGLVLGLWMLAVVGTSCLGFSVTRWMFHKETDPLIEELPVINQLDVYSEVRDFEFLERLSREQGLVEELQTGVEREAN